LIATVSDGELISLKPDREHPVTKGFACHKGLATLDLHKDSDRLNYLQKNSVKFSSVSVEMKPVVTSRRA
jgi:anaerobic selenocysteine-containing dehydrogenase